VRLPEKVAPGAGFLLFARFQGIRKTTEIYLVCVRSTVLLQAILVRATDFSYLKPRGDEEDGAGQPRRQHPRCVVHR
jgi:hypothetical protein